MKHIYNFSQFKSEINLTQYAAHIGYEIDKKKSTRSSIAMRNADDKIIITRRGGIWVYFSPLDDNDNGTIINFVQNRTGKSLYEIGAELQSWIGGGVSLPEPKSYIHDVQEQEYDPARVAQIFKSCRAIESHVYLEGRGLTQGIVSSPRFAGRIFKDRYDNVVFPHYNGAGVCGLELKNADKALFVRGSEKTFWRSNCFKGDDMLIIGEAVIDVLSYSALFPNESAVYAATGGGMSPEQETTLKACVLSFKSLKTIILAMDNDEGGARLMQKIKNILANSGFCGKIIEHSPKVEGQDWNNVLQGKNNE